MSYSLDECAVINAEDQRSYQETCTDAFGNKTFSLKEHLSNTNARFLEKLNGEGNYDDIIREHFETSVRCVKRRLCKANEHEGGDEGHKHIMLEYIRKLEKLLTIEVLSGRNVLTTIYREELANLRREVDNLKTTPKESRSRISSTPSSPRGHSSGSPRSSVGEASPKIQTSHSTSQTRQHAAHTPHPPTNSRPSSTVRPRPQPRRSQK